ncbi:MAG TPA: hypothetical protein VE196_03305 [Pseudonocardiaceae bacterium]|nr:hypothetical protein [Pseudonocardiaceae bacterium]
MGETTLQLVIRQVRPRSVRAVCAVLDRFQMRVGWDGPAAAGERVELAELYTRRGVDVGESTELADALIRAAPDCAFKTWTDPVEDALGLLVRHLPEVGSHIADCDHEGVGRYSAAALASDSDLGVVLGRRWDLLDQPGTPATVHADTRRAYRVVHTVTSIVLAPSPLAAQRAALAEIDGQRPDIDCEVSEVHGHDGRVAIIV